VRALSALWRRQYGWGISRRVPRVRAPCVFPSKKKTRFKPLARNWYRSVSALLYKVLSANHSQGQNLKVHKNKKAAATSDLCTFSWRPHLRHVDGHVFFLEKRPSHVPKTVQNSNSGRPERHSPSAQHRCETRTADTKVRHARPPRVTPSHHRGSHQVTAARRRDRACLCAERLIRRGPPVRIPPKDNLPVASSPSS